MTSREQLLSGFDASHPMLARQPLTQAAYQFFIARLPAYLMLADDFVSSRGGDCQNYYEVRDQLAYWFRIAYAAQVSASTAPALSDHPLLIQMCRDIAELRAG